MGLETGTYISDLVVTNPTSSDPKSAGDDHLRLLKSTIKTTFPNITGAMTKTHTELNTVTDRGLIAGQTWTGTHTFPATTYGVTAAFGSSGVAYATLDYVNAVSFNTVLPAQTGNATKFLQTDGSAASWQKAGSLIYLSTVTAAAAATVDIETGFGSTYDDYVIVASAFRTSTGNTQINLTMKIGGSYISAGYDGMFIYDQSASPTRVVVTSSNASSAAVANGAISSGNGVSSLTIDVFDANSSLAKSLKGSGVSNSTATSSLQTFDFAAGCRTTGVLTGIRLTPAAGTITGTFRLYGRAKL